MKRIKSLILALAATTVMLWGQTEVSTPIIPSWERASEGATVISLSLQQAKDTAIRYNRQLQNASYDVKIAQAQRWQTIASMLPQVTAGYDYQNMMGFKMEMRIPVGKNPATGEDMVNVIERASPPNGTFSISAGMQISGQQIVGAMINKIAVDMADISRLQTEQTITSTVTQLYISILANRHIVSLLDSSKMNIEKIYQSTVEAVKIGVTEQTEADKLYVQVMKLESALNSARQGLEMTYSSMKLQLGVSADTYIELTDNLDQLTNAEVSLRLLHTKFDITDNYNYRLMSKNLELSRKQIKLAAMGYSPSLTIGYRYSDIKYFDGEPMMNMNPPNVFSIGVKVPLFTSGRTFMSIREKKYSYLKAKNTFDDSHNQLEIKDKQLRFNLNSAYENFIIQKKNIAVTNSVFNKVAEKFRYGRASSLEVTQASSDFINAQNTYIQAIMNMTNAQIELRNLLNK